MNMASIKKLYDSDPLGFLKARFNGKDPIVTGSNEVCLVEPLAVRRLFLDRVNFYEEDSSFFSTRHGVFGPRAAQLRIRTESRKLFRRHLDTFTETKLKTFLRANLELESNWPEAGNYLALRFFLPILLAPGSDPKLTPLLENIVRHSALAGARSKTPRWRRRLLQFRTTWLFAKEIERRKKHSLTEPRDVLDVLIQASDKKANDPEIAELFLAFLFSIVVIGFLLAWALYLDRNKAPKNISSEWIVLEALRAWPTSFMLSRIVKADHVVESLSVKKNDTVTACPHLVNRNPNYWINPDVFDPTRWSDPQARGNPAFLSFGHGPHRCAASDHVIELVTKCLDIFRADGFGITPQGAEPGISAQVTPPQFGLTWLKP